MATLENKTNHIEDGTRSGTSSGRSSASTTPSRKRICPSSFISEDEAPPNKRLHTPTEEEKESFFQEKQMLYKRLLDAEKNPYILSQQMFPFLPLGSKGLTPVSPVYSYLQQQQQQIQASGSYLTSSPSGSVLSIPTSTAENNQGPTTTMNISGLPTPGGSSIGSTTPPRSSFPFSANFLKYPFSPPTPSSLSSLSLLSPWSNGNMNPGAPVTDTSKHSSPERKSARSPRDSKSNNDEADEDRNSQSVPQTQSNLSGLWSMPTTTPAAQSVLGALSGQLPNTTGLLPGPSPLGYFQHNQPMSPMMLLHSPYASSLSSVPSVGSSSGCSSSSDGPPGSALSQNHSYAPSEYHVGPRRPLVEKIAEELDIQSDGPSNSGRNTPIDVGIESSTALSDEVDGTALAQRLADNTSNPIETSCPIQTPAHVQHRKDLPVHHQTPYPFSVESLSSSVNPQGFLGSMNNIERPSSGVSSMSSSVSSRESTPEPDDMKHPTYSPSVGCDTFCLVPGRLSLLSSTQKYRVGVDEVRRRLSHPECLNASVLGGILRRAKSKNGGHVLRQRLESIGVSLPPGRRKATDLSLFTSLVEGEAVHLANDFNRLCDNSFPHGDLAQIIASQHTGTPEAQHRISMVKATQLIVSELQAMVNAVGGPSNVRPNDPTNPYPGLINFSLLTHGFGNPAINASLNVLQTYLKDLQGYYEGSKTIQPDTRCMHSTNKLSGSSSRTNTPAQQFSTNSQHMSSNSMLDTNEVTINGVSRNRSGLFVCLKQEPSD